MFDHGGRVYSNDTRVADAIVALLDEIRGAVSNWRVIFDIKNGMMSGGRKND